MGWSAFRLLFECLLLTTHVTSNFRNSPKCFHDDSSSCREGSCAVTSSMSTARLNCHLMTVKTVTNLSEPQMKTGPDIRIMFDFMYVSKSAYCYPYLNLTWIVQPELLMNTSHFYLNISYLHLGQLHVLHKLMNLSSKSNINEPVRFFYPCHQIAYPGVSIEASVSALSERQELLSSSTGKISAPCQIKFGKNPARVQPGSRLKEDWIPDQRMLLGFGKVEVFFTMPDCSIDIWLLILQLNHTSIKEVFQSKKMRCSCVFNSSVTFENMPEGNYTLTYLFLTTTSTIGQKILQLEVSLLGNEMLPPFEDHVTSRSNKDILERKASPQNVESTEDPEEESTEDWKLKMWLVIGATILLLWVVVLFMFCYRVKSSSQEFTVCLRGTLNSGFKDGKNFQKTSENEEKKTKAPQWGDKFDSGICSKCSRFNSFHGDRSLGYDNASLERCCTCSDHCPECFSFDFQLKFHPPSDDGISVNSREFKERIETLNLESNQL